MNGISMDHLFVKFLPQFIRTKLEGRHVFQKTVTNTGWLFADKIVRMGVAFVVTIWVARYLGPEKFGFLSYSIAFVALFNFIANLGLDTVVIRNIVRDPSSAEETLGSAFILKLVGGIVTLCSTIAVIIFLRPGDALTLSLVGIIAAGAIFQSFDTIDLWFQSQIRSKYSVYPKGAAFLLIAIIKIILIVLGAPVVAFAIAGLAEIIIGSAGLVIAYRVSGHRIAAWSLKKDQIIGLMRDGWPLALSGLVVMIYMKIDQVMIGQMVGQEAVGVYSVAVALSEAFYFIPAVIVGSAFPAIISLLDINASLYRVRLQQMHDFLSLLAFFIALAVSFLSYFIIDTLFGEKFIEAAVILNIYIWACLLVFPGNVRANLVVVENAQKVALVFRSLGAVLNVVLNYFLIPKYGGVGAAWATIASFVFPVLIVSPFNTFIRMTVFMTLKSYLLPVRLLVYRGALYKT